jgi:hypothetical protein
MEAFSGSGLGHTAEPFHGGGAGCERRRGKREKGGGIKNGVAA